MFKNPDYTIFQTIGYCINVLPGFCWKSWPGASIPTLGQGFDLPPGVTSAFWGQLDSALPRYGGYDGRSLENRTFVPRLNIINFRNSEAIAGGNHTQCPATGDQESWISALAGFCSKLNGRRAASPSSSSASKAPRSGYFDIVSVRGTNYTDNKRGDASIERDTKRKLLDLNLLR